VRLQAALSGAASPGAQGSQLAYRRQAHPSSGQQGAELDALLAQQKGAQLTLAPGMLQRTHSLPRYAPGSPLPQPSTTYRYTPGTLPEVWQARRCLPTDSTVIVWIACC